MDEMGPIINEFLTESYENLDQLDQDLVELEANPEEISLLASIFRTIHTIKGTCGFLGFSKLESIAHVGENLLSQLRDGEMKMNPQIANALLAMVDAVRQILACIESDRSEGDVDYSNLVEVLTKLNKGESVDIAPSASGEGSEAPVAEAVPATPPAPEQSNGNSHPAETVEEAPVEAEPVAGTPEPEAPVEETALQPADPQAPVETATADPLEGGDGMRASDKKGATESSIRVDVDLLDKLMNLVGELVLSRNQIVQFATGEKDSSFITTTQHLNQLTSELQEGVMKTRMQPIGTIWSKYPRVVRDLSQSIGKRVRLEMEGKDTELDKTLIEAIKDPLTHMVRNSVDHGIEMPDTRIANGKNGEGVLSLRAYHEGGQVNIEINDDGGGIHPEKIKKKAIEKNIITPERAARMNDRELINLIFAPGFSTAEKVSNISGRGVGMDVVRTNIEKIGGKIEINSEAGKGTALKIKIPLTLAIIPALTVTCKGGRYCIPQVSLLELVRLDQENTESQVEMIQGTPVYRLRGNLLPLVYLSKELGFEGGAIREGDSVNIVVQQADNRQFGLVVEKILDTEEIVVKPLGNQLKSITAYSGATIMGDGKVALILDVMGLAQKAHVVSDETRSEAATREDRFDASGEKQTLLVFESSNKSRMAVPLSMVARLEEFEASAIETSGTQEVVQYRGDIMPLIHLSHFFGGPDREEQNEMLQAIVYCDRGRNVGVVVDRIIDIVEEHVEIKTGTGRKGTLGSSVVQGKVTDLVDVEGIILEADPGFYAETSENKLLAAAVEGGE